MKGIKNSSRYLIKNKWQTGSDLQYGVPKRNWSVLDVFVSVNACDFSEKNCQFLSCFHIVTFSGYFYS